VRITADWVQVFTFIVWVEWERAPVGKSRQGWPASARPSQPPSSLSSNSERMSKEEESEEGGSEESEKARDGEDDDEGVS